MLIEGLHGETGTPIVGAFNRDALFVAFDANLADAYAEDRVVHRVRYESTNPLDITDPAQFKVMWTESGAAITEGAFHPVVTGTVNRWARARGYDAIRLLPVLFDSDEGWEMAGGTYGEPQAILLYPNRATFE